jgi:hypothetical protein
MSTRTDQPSRACSMRATRSLRSRLLWAITARTRPSRHFTIRRLRSGLSAEGCADLGHVGTRKESNNRRRTVHSSHVRALHRAGQVATFGWRAPPGAERIAAKLSRGWATHRRAQNPSKMKDVESVIGTK